jgi:protein-disulfide isomerase
MMSKRFLLILLACLVVLGGIFWISSGNDSSGSSASPTNHLLGAGKKSVTLTEYGDYQCPVCSGYHPILKQVVDKYKDDISFQFRNLPLSQIHQNAFAAARSAEAADLQGKFWEMHDLLYENQISWSEATNPTSYFEAMASQLGLNVDKFRKDFASSTVNNLINADVAEFNKTRNEQATPTFFINGVKVENSKFVDDSKGQATLEKFSEIIDAEIARQASASAQ